jgi:hypothetical protein
MTVKRVELADGSIRYRYVIDIGRDPFTGKRRQRTFTFDDEAEAEADYRRRREEREQVYGRRGDSRLRGVTVNQILDDYLDSLTCSDKTVAHYQGALRGVRERIGERKAQTITKGDIEHVIEYLATAARRRGGRPGSGLSDRSISLAIGRLRAAYELAILKGKITRRVIPIEANPRLVVL